MAFKDLLARFKKGLAKTARLFDVRSWFGRKVDQDFLDELEAKLIRADVGVKATRSIIDRVREAFADKTADEDLVNFLKQEMKALLQDPRPGALHARPERAHGHPGRRGQRLGQDDLDRQARPAAQGRGQLDPAGGLRHLPRRRRRPARHLGRPAGSDLVRGNPDADPASVAHDACDKALARKVDFLIVDTAGRLHTQTHLMRELEKVRGIIARKIAGAPHEALLVLDATNGQNAIQQAKIFTQTIDCTGVILTKLDGTAKGGVVVAVRQQTDLPVKFVGVGEAIDDLQPFDPDAFVESLFS